MYLFIAKEVVRTVASVPSVIKDLFTEAQQLVGRLTR